MFRSQVNNHSSIWFPVTLSTESNQIRAMQRRNSASQHKKTFLREHQSVRKTASISPPQQRFRRRSWSDCGVFVIEQAREPLPHVARFIEMIGHAHRAPAHGERKTAKIGHEGE